MSGRTHGPCASRHSRPARLARATAPRRMRHRQRHHRHPSPTARNGEAPGAEGEWAWSGCGRCRYRPGQRTPARTRRARKVAYASAHDAVVSVASARNRTWLARHCASALPRQERACQTRASPQAQRETSSGRGVGGEWWWVVVVVLMMVETWQGRRW